MPLASFAFDCWNEGGANEGSSEIRGKGHCEQNLGTCGGSPSLLSILYQACTKPAPLEAWARLASKVEKREKEKKVGLALIFPTDKTTPKCLSNLSFFFSLTVKGETFSSLPTQQWGPSNFSISLFFSLSLFFPVTQCKVLFRLLHTLSSLNLINLADTNSHTLFPRNTHYGCRKTQYGNDNLF